MTKSFVRMEPEVRKATIYAAAHCLVSEHDGKVTRKMVAELSGVSPGLVNKYFGSFAQLLISVSGESGVDVHFKPHTPVGIRERRESVLCWAIDFAKQHGVESITNKLISDSCEIGIYRVYLIFGGVKKLREAITQRMMENEQNHI